MVLDQQFKTETIIQQLHGHCRFDNNWNFNVMTIVMTYSVTIVTTIHD